MRRGLVCLTFTIAAIVAMATLALARRASTPDNASTVERSEPGTEIRRSELNKPWELAPREQIVSGRDTMSFRKQGTLLATASRGIPKVDEAALMERKCKMYEGRRFYRGLARAASERSSRRAVAVRRKLAAATTEAAGDSTLGWVTWTLLAAIVATVLVAWRMGWFVPFSVRAEARKHTLRAASKKPRSRPAKGPGMTLLRRR